MKASATDRVFSHCMLTFVSVLSSPAYMWESMRSYPYYIGNGTPLCKNNGL